MYINGEFNSSSNLYKKITWTRFHVTDVIKKDINLVGYLASIPSLTIIFILPIAGILMDSCQKRTKIDDTKVPTSIFVHYVQHLNVHFSAKNSTL